MAELTRRTLFAGAAAATAATALSPLATTPAHADTSKQVPGAYRYKVGSYECTSINDGARSFPLPDTFVKNVPKEEALAAAEAAYMPKGMVTVPFNPQLINTGSKLVLIDTGNGVMSSVGVFDTSAQANESTRLASEWVRDEKLENILQNPPKVTDGEIIVHKTNGSVKA